MIKLRRFVRRLLHLDDWRKAGPFNSLEDLFTFLYRENSWKDGESRSGAGSTLKNTESIRAALPGLFRKYGITSVLDAPCGDFNWMKHVPLEGIAYRGVDIVGELIDSNNRLYRSDGVEFFRGDLTSCALPASGLILCRDCLFHLSYGNISRALANFRASGSTYLLATTFVRDDRENIDKINGDFRPLNLGKPPFGFPQPLETINENCTLEKGACRDKSLCLWKLSDIAPIMYNG